jgi:hypothetical protein
MEVGNLLLHSSDLPDTLTPLPRVLHVKLGMGELRVGVFMPQPHDFGVVIVRCSHVIFKFLRPPIAGVGFPTQ